ncbi:MAG TPA: hypothetical protein VHM91_01000 [Verrucomicrobiales bacterium]|jgi:hypothetical protein|nr:hypothetical protein [Verrucomicrobiales bacterium]
MQDDELQNLLTRARRAQNRLDTSRSELAFATRMQSVLRTTRQDFGTAGRFQTWLRATVGLATVTGILAFFVLAGREAIESDDTLTAWWTNSSAVWDFQLFN